MEIQNASTTPSKYNQLVNVNTVRWESRNIITQPGEIDDKKSEFIDFDGDDNKVYKEEKIERRYLRTEMRSRNLKDHQSSFYDKTHDLSSDFQMSLFFIAKVVILRKK